MAANPATERPLIQVILHTLGRIDEVLRITWADVNFYKQTITLYTRKRKDGAYEPDDLPMNVDLYQILWDMWKKRKQNQWVFFNEKTGTRYMKRPKLMRSLCKRARIPHFGFHDLRHFLARLVSRPQKTID